MIPSPLMLIIRKQRIDGDRLEPLLRALADLSLDAYTTRVNLTGVGLALLTRGTQEELDRIGQTLTAHGIPWAITPPVTRSAPPVQLRYLRVREDGVVFNDRMGKTHLIPKGSRVLAVLGGMDGKQVTRIASARRWEGEGAKPVTRRDQYRGLLRGNPILDILVAVRPLLVSSSPPVPDLHIRVVPGRFDSSGLGEEATESSSLNLDRLLMLVKRTAGVFDLDLDFGMTGLPGCMPDFSRTDSEAHNIKALTNYAIYAFRVRGGLSGERNAQTGRGAATSAIQPLPLAVMGPLAMIPTAGQPDFGEPAPEGALLPELDLPAETIADPGDLPSSALLPPPPLIEQHPSVWNNPRSRVIVTMGVLSPALIAFLANLKALEGFREWLAFVMLGRGGLAATVSLVALWLCTRYFRLKRWVDNLPTSRVRSLAMGMVELSGVAERAYNLVSPVSSTACVWFRIAHFVRTGVQTGAKTKWKLTRTQHSGSCPFYVRDDTGRVLVNPQGATLWGSHRSVYGGEMGTLMAGGFNLNSNERIVEELIPELQPLYVLGFAAPLDDPAPSLKERTIEKLRRLKSNRDELMRYDLDGDGTIDENEWQHAVADMRRRAVEEESARLAQPKPDAARVAIMQPEDSRLPFLISAGSEASLTRRYAVISVLAFVVALGSLLVAVVQASRAFGLE